MSQAQNSGASCVTPVTTNVPGISGLSSYTTITQSFVVPAVGGFVSTTFASTAQFVSGQAVAIGVSTIGFADFIGIFIVQVGPNNLVSLQLVSALAAVGVALLLKAMTSGVPLAPPLQLPISTPP